MSAGATIATDLAANEATARADTVAVEPGSKARPFRVLHSSFTNLFLPPQGFAGNLTYNTDEAALKDFFQEFSADIASAQIIFHGHRSAGYGFVTFNAEDAADKAIASLDKKELNGRAVIRRCSASGATCEPTRREAEQEGRRGSKAIPGEATEPKADGETPAAATDGAAQANAAKPKKNKKSNKRKAKKPSNAEETSGEAPADGTVAPADASADANAPAEHTRRYRKAKAPRRPRGEAPTSEPSTSVLFVANLASSVDEAQLTEFFTSAGVTVKSARVVRWRWGTPRKSKGYAFVDVGGPEEQQKAMDAVSGKSIADRELSQLAHHTSLAWPGEIKPMSIVIAGCAVHFLWIRGQSVWRYIGRQDQTQLCRFSSNVKPNIPNCAEGLKLLSICILPPDFSKPPFQERSGIQVSFNQRLAKVYPANKGPLRNKQVKPEPIIVPHLVKRNEPGAVLPRNVGDIINDRGRYDARPRMRNHFGRGSSTCTEMIQQVASNHPLCTFEETSMPVVDMYREQGKLVEVDAEKTIPEVHVDVKVTMDAKFAGTGVAPKA